MKMSVKLTGLKDLQKQISKLSEKVKPEIVKGLAESAIRVESAAKRNAPIDTGRLRGSITHIINKSQLTATVGTNVDYAPHVEFGTVNMEAQPFLFPALESNRRAIIKILKTAVNRAAKLMEK